MTQPARERRAGEPARLLLVCDDSARGERLLDALGQPDAPLFEAKAIGGWEVVPAGAVVLFERAPDLSRTRRRLRFARSRVIVVAWPDQPRLIELVLREKGTVVTWPGSVERLAEELARCLDSDDGTVVLEPERLADELCQELSRRLRRNAPQLRLADSTRIEALVDKLTCAVLEEARELDGASVADLDWEHVSTAVQTREESAIFRRRAADGAPDRDPKGEDTDPGLRALRPPPPEHPPDPVSLMETRPYSAVSEEQAELLSHVRWVDDEPDEPARQPSRPPPLPSRPSVHAVSLARPRRRMRTGLGVGLVCVAAAVAGFLGMRSAGGLPSVEAPPAASPPAARPPVATLELGLPTVTPVVEDEVAEPAPVARPAPEPEIAPEASSREERARRSNVRARAHRSRGRLGRALAAARFAARLAPEVESYGALVAELEAAGDAAPVTAEPESVMLPE